MYCKMAYPASGSKVYFFLVRYVFSSLYWTLNQGAWSKNTYKELEKAISELLPAAYHEVRE